MVNGKEQLSNFNQSKKSKRKFSNGKAITYPFALGLLFFTRANSTPLVRPSANFIFRRLWQVWITTLALSNCHILIRGQKRLSWAFYGLFQQCRKINSLLRGQKNPSGVVLSEMRTADKTFNLLSNDSIVFVGLHKIGRTGYVPRYVESSLSKIK